MAKQEGVALAVRSVSKTFKLPHERHSGLKQTIVSKVGGKHRRGYELQHVLKDISFEVKKGEFFGIVGRNGSGKSTLLKLISGIYTPDSGSVKIEGSLTPFIELGVGFNPELTGRENVFLNGALMGFSRKEMEAKYDQIVEFAELPDFMDQKLKNYSSGMQVRLAFSIAIQSESDILILDEVLAVGDESFQRKCNDFFDSIKEDKTKTVILVTHGMDNVKRYCDRAMMIHDGSIVEIGDPDDVAETYSAANRKKPSESDNPVGAITEEYASVDITPSVSGEIIEFTIDILPKVDIDNILIAFAVLRGNTPVYWWGNNEHGTDMSINLAKDKKKTVKVTVQNIFPNGVYDMDYIIVSKDSGDIYAKYTRNAEFEIKLRSTESNPIKNLSYWRPSITSVDEI